MTVNAENSTVSSKQSKQLEYEVNGNQIKLSIDFVRSNLVNGDDATDKEILNFMMMCQHNKLDPFLKEAFLVKYKGKAQIIVSKEAFMKRADANENYEGFEAGVIVQRDNQIVEENGSVMLPTDKLLGGWAKVYRSDRKMPVISRLSLREFTSGKSTWQTMPGTMIRKTAIVNALREAFPQSFGAMYTEEEQGDRTDVTPSTDAEKSTLKKLVNKGKNVNTEAKKVVAEKETNYEANRNTLENIKNIAADNGEIIDKKPEIKEPEYKEQELFNSLANINNNDDEYNVVGEDF